ncbi:MAG TPA: hypothetical protein VMU16_02740 [Candidatus Binataceae bacterium]|nr:hypothetical protein [Candidatus Binataceae bacterium]
MTGQDEADTRLLREMFERAESYVKSLEWCTPITERFFGYGIGGIIAVFFFKFATKINGTDDRLWVVVGDVPSAYLVTDNALNPAAALSLYCDMMEAWATAVLNRTPLDVVFPITAEPTAEHANMLLSRITFIREKIIPACHLKSARSGT